MKIGFIKDFIINKLESEKGACAKQWDNPKETATRYFHIDNFLPDEFANTIYDAFLKDGNKFHKRKSFREQKNTFANLTKSSPILADITKVFQLPEIIERISHIIDMKALEADPSLYAGGLSMMSKGDFLNPHIDNSHDGNRKRYRRLNLLLYVTPDWMLDNGGNFELWDDKVKTPKIIVSKFNR